MNRSIEFRVWDKDNEEMVSFPITLCRKFDADRGCGEVFVNKIFTDRDYIFMQFTGLTDVNGVKIFEGDIVEKEEQDKSSEEYATYISKDFWK